jgi:hypothetical protein
MAIDFAFAEPADVNPSPGQPAQRSGAIPDSHYDGLSAAETGQICPRKKRRQRSAMGPPRSACGGIRIENPAVAGDKHKFGEMEFTKQELRDFLTSKADAEMRKASTLPKNTKPSCRKISRCPPAFRSRSTMPTRSWPTCTAGLIRKAWINRRSANWSAGTPAQKRERPRSSIAAHVAEVAKMGANGTQRVTALETWLRGVVGDKLAGPMRSMMVTADIVKGLETLQQKFLSQAQRRFRNPIAYRPSRKAARRTRNTTR